MKMLESMKVVEALEKSNDLETELRNDLRPRNENMSMNLQIFKI